MNILYAVITVLAVLCAALAVCLFIAGSSKKKSDEKYREYEKKTDRERKLNALNALDADNEAANEFFSNISHDMRTPLNTITGFADLLNKEDLTPAEKDYVDKIRVSSFQLSQLINDTILISQINTKTLRIDPESCTISNICNGPVFEARKNCDLKGISFESDIPAGDTVISADPDKTGIIVRYLLENAIRFTDPGGKISIRASQTQQQGSVVYKITVKDNGKGIPPDVLPDIYRPFALDSAPAYQETGTGLTLAIVKGIVDLLGGTAEVKSSLGSGTEFTVTLCFSKNSVSDGGKDKAVSGTSYSLNMKKKILICEDNELNLEVVKSLLERNGYKVLEAENGKRGLEIYLDSDEKEISCILMDLRMPLMDGYTAAQEIRKADREDARTIPIIAMTADTFEEDRKKCLKAGMNDHIAKPFVPDDLLAKINGYIK